jgi:hypothetical protein
MYISPNVNTHSDILRLGDLQKKEKIQAIGSLSVVFENTSRRTIANIKVKQALHKPITSAEGSRRW